MGSIYFLTEPHYDTDRHDIDPGAWIDIASNIHAWPDGTKAPEQVLCRSKADPKHYKLDKYRREIQGTEWEDTGLSFGGTFTAESWDRFARAMASLSALHPVLDDEVG